MRQFSALVLAALSLVVSGCLEVGGEGKQPASAVKVGSADEAPATGNLDSEGNGKMDEAPTTEEEKHLKGEYAKFTCPDVCRLLVRAPFQGTYAIVVILPTHDLSEDLLSLDGQQAFSGSIEFPVYEGELIDVWVGGNSKEYDTVLEMVSDKFVFWAEHWTKDGVGEAAYKWQGFHGGDLEDPPYHYEVVRRFGEYVYNN